MNDKEMLKRDDTNMKHIYHLAQEEQKTKSYLLERFVNSMYNGSASSLVLQLLGNRKTSKKELQLIKDMLNKLDTDK